MENTYDVLLNFNNYAYEFYEWDKDDNINHIKKIPCYKVNNDDLLDFINYNLVVDKDFLEKIKNKTQIFYKGKIKTIEYACILFSEYEVIGLLFNNNGNLIGKSKLLFDEADDIIKEGMNNEIINIKYNKLSKTYINNHLTRRENKTYFLLLKYLDDIFEKEKKDEIKYLYYECFNKKEDDYIKSYMKLKNKVLNADYNIINNLKLVMKTIKK